MSPDFGKHLLEVEDLLQKHALVENDIALQAERVQSASAAALKFANGDSKYSSSVCFAYLQALLRMRTQNGVQALDLDQDLTLI